MSESLCCHKNQNHYIKAKPSSSSSSSSSQTTITTTTTIATITTITGTKDLMVKLVGAVST